MKPRRLVLAMAFSFAAMALAVGSVETSAAAWSDPVHAAVEVRAGTWGPGVGTIGCYPVDPNLAATCELTGIVWTYWGSGYRVQFGLSTSHPERFEWEVRFDLASVYEGPNPPPLSQGTPMFPGDPTPDGWAVTGLQQAENICLVSAELPVFSVRGVQAGFDWNRTIGGDRPVLSNSQGFQVASGSTGLPPSCG